VDDDSRLIACMRYLESWHRVDNIYKSYVKSVGLNYSAMQILKLLRNTKEVYSQKCLCEKLGLPKQLIYTHIKSFWKQGYVELKEAEDRRNKEIILTPKGSKYIEEILMPLNNAEKNTWGNFTIEEILDFAEKMEKYEKHLESNINNLQAD